jgi:hypothetical protein
VRSAKFFLVFIASSAVARADVLTDLRATLGQLAATTAVHGSIDATSTMSNNEEAQPDNGRATVGFDVSDAGLRILYPRLTLTQAAAEARGEAIDPERATPARSGLRRVRPLHIAELLDAAAALGVSLESAQLVETKPASYRGKPSRLIVLKLTPKLSKATSKHMKKLDSSLSVWLGDDGVPVAAERSTYFKASLLLISFENTQKESWSYMRTGDRLIATRYEESEKSDGFGQHNTSQTIEVVRIE